MYKPTNRVLKVDRERDTAPEEEEYQFEPDQSYSGDSEASSPPEYAPNWDYHSYAEDEPNSEKPDTASVSTAKSDQLGG
jgi:hypothetical protein